MRCLFISDAHYPKNHKIIDFLLENYKSYDAIYILGDLFEFYFGYSGFFYSHHIGLINTLNIISKQTRVVLFEGNHEYRLEGIRQFIDAEIVKEFTSEKIGEYNVLLGHGDTIDKKDLSYRLFRAVLKNSLTLNMINRLNPKYLFGLSKKASKFSKKRLKNKYDRHTDKALIEFADLKIRSGYDVVVLAHTHTPAIKHLSGGLYLNCGDFFEQMSYVTYTDKDGFRLNYLK